MSKPLRWKVGDPSYEGTEWAVKNLFELKNARRVLNRGQRASNATGTHAQNGFAILFTVRNQDGGSPWSTIEDVTFTNNLVRHVGGGVNVLGHDDNHPSQQTRRLLIHNNVFLDVGESWGAGRLFQLLDGTNNVDDRAQHGAADRQHSLRRRPCAAHGVRLPEQCRTAQRARHHRVRDRTGNQTMARYFPRAVMQRKRHRRRQRRTVSTGQYVRSDRSTTPVSCRYAAVS